MNCGIYNSKGIYPDEGVYNTPSSGIRIDGRNYKTKKIGKIVWTIENLLLETSDSGVNQSHLEFGRYYPHSDLTIIESMLQNGWHIPSQSDFQELIDACDSDVVAAQSLGYNLWPNATNSSKFGAVPSRTISSTDSQLDRSILWTSSITSDQEHPCILIRTSEFGFFPYSSTTDLMVCVRACKTALPKNLFDKSTSWLLPGYCGTIGTDFIVDVNNGAQKSLVIPITEEMRGKTLRFSCDIGDDVANRWICGQVNEFPESGRFTYEAENILFISSLRQSASRYFSDAIHQIGDYNYIVFFFSSGLTDTSKFIDSLMICSDGNYYPYKNF